MTKIKVQMPGGIRTKLMAAIAMLLVATILMVSSTYAWFTLSTAPEVTGITTSVGANGNLEIALLNTETAKDLSKITSGIGDSSSVKAVQAANITWGNLVDLSNGSYGLDKISLLPAKLNVTNGVIPNAAILYTPTYGSDGRVADLVANTQSATYSGTTFKYGTTQDYGVRAIGTASALSDQQIGKMDALSNISSKATAAKSAASSALANNGGKLANIVMTHVSNDEATFTQADVAAIKNTADGLLTAEGYLEDSVLAAIKASFTSLEDAKYTAAMGAVNGKTLSEAVTDIESVEGVTVPAAFTTINTNLTGIKTDLTTLKESCDGITSESVTWEQIRPLLAVLMDPALVTLNGQGASKDNISAIINVYTSQGKLELSVPTGAGVIADIADFTGDYVASIKMNVSYGVITADDVTATMTTATTAPTVTADTLKTNAAAVTAVGAATTDVNLSDYYGYALDFAFRTNAASSNLLLQTAGIQRIYNSDTDASTNAATQGEGSYMEFTTSSDSFGTDAMTKLMGALRIVFAEPANDGSYNVLATAKLDTAEAKIDGTSVKANMYLYTSTAAVEATIGQDAYTVLSSDNSEADNYDEAYNETDHYARTGEAEAYTYIGKDAYDALPAESTAAKEASETLSKDKDKSVITALTQNVAKKVTVIVYLDGDLVDNTMVANAQKSMSGSMNLQFSSSATLVPMKNTSLYEGSAS